jgi:hypothetical protein
VTATFGARRHGLTTAVASEIVSNLRVCWVADELSVARGIVSGRVGTHPVHSEPAGRLTADQGARCLGAVSRAALATSIRATHNRDRGSVAQGRGSA